VERTTAVIVVLTLGVAVLFCALRASFSNANLTNRLGQGKWDFNQSWASNLAAVGSILGIVLGAASGLQTPGLALTAVILSVFYGAVLVAGPIVYAATQVRVGDELEGTVWGFLVATALTLWAAWGEAVTAMAFFVDLGQQVPGFITWAFVAIVVLAIIALFWYAWKNAGWILTQTASPITAGRAAQPGRWNFM
jgi:hypothetical protein